jgi:hypothetical protein
MEKKKALYAYFGYLGIFSTDIPGHTFYQVGLIDQLCKTHGVDNVDFYSYLSADNICRDLTKPVYPDDMISGVFQDYTNDRINEYNIEFNQVISAIENGEYEKIFLKARFRNLSTLTKGLSDARQFEKIIKTACENGQAERIVILDTDLSLDPEFVTFCEEQGINFEIPSIDYPNVSTEFLEACKNAWLLSPRFDKIDSVFYYGNISFKNYKTGHAKNPILSSALETIQDFRSFTGKSYSLGVAGKVDPKLIEILDCTQFIKRDDRANIWKAYSESSLSLNISKDLYLERGFTPARVYESLIFGAIPISFGDDRIHPALGFSNLEELNEILAFFKDSSPSDRASIYETCVANVIGNR